MPFDATALLRHRDFVRAIAGRLLDDPHLVDDVEQETWATALARPPRSQGALGAWLGQVARRLAFRAMRTRERRGRRERAASPPRPPSSPDDLAKILETQQRVVDAVLRLDALYREVILLRFYESLPPRDVAARLGVPVNTVRTRTRRALELLRADLERGPSGRRALGLLPLLVPPRAARWTIGALLMSTKTKLAAVAALLLLTAGAVWQIRPREAAPRATAPPAVATQPPAATATVCRLTGAVVDEAGRPVPSARVEAASLETFTDDKGEFALETPREGPDVVVASSGALRAQQVVELKHGEVSAGTLVLAATVTVTGVVLDERGEGAPGAVVEAWANLPARDDPLAWTRAPPPITASTIAGPAGAFQLALPRGAETVLRARKGDSMSLEEAGWDLREDQVRVVLRLRKLGAIRGRVEDLAGAPVAGASVHLVPPPREYRWPQPTVRSVRGVTAITASDGTFSLAAPPEVYAVLVTHPAFVPFHTARVLAPRDGWTIRLAPGQALKGIVEAGGHPAPGASVRIVPTDGHAAPQQTVTDEAGGFAFPHAALALPFHVFADGGPLGTALLRDVAWRGEPLRVSLDPVKDVTGRVVLQDGTPVEGVRVEAWEFMVRTDTTSHYRGHREASSGPDGRFRLVGASRAVSIGLHVAEDRYVQTGSEGTAATGEVTLTVVAMRHLTVHVVDAEGNPVAGADVLGRVTGDDGTCRVLAPRYVTEVVATKPGFRGTGAIPKEGDSVEVALDPVPVLRGVVRDPEGRPLADVRVEATYSRRLGGGASEGGTCGATFTDREGAFALDVFSDVDLRVTLERTGFLPAIEMVRAEKPLEVVLQLGRAIRGRVVDEEGSPVAGAAVSAHRTAAWSQTTWTAADGRFVLDDLEPGEHLRISAPGYASRQLVETDPKSNGEQVFVLPRELVITGQVVRGDGTPAYPVSVSAEAEKPPGPFVGVMTDAEGKFRIHGLLPGRYTLRVDASARFAGREDLLDADWEPMTGVVAGTTGVVLRQKPPQILAGVVVDENDRGLRGARVNLYDAAGNFVKGEYVDELGNFRIPVRSGKYEVRVNLSGMAFKRVKGVASGAEDLVLRFAPGKEIRGQLDSAGGYAAGSGSVQVWSDDVHGYAEIDRFGGFTIRGLPAGTYEILAWGAAAGGGAAMRATGRADAGASDVRVELKKGEPR